MNEKIFLKAKIMRCTQLRESYGSVSYDEVVGEVENIKSNLSMIQNKKYVKEIMKLIAEYENDTDIEYDDYFDLLNDIQDTLIDELEELEEED